MVRTIVAALLTVAVLTLTAAGATAQTTPPAPTTTEGIDLTKCISALPPPECERKPEHSGDSGGSAQLALLAVMTLGLGVIGFVVVRSTRRNTIARRDAAGRVG